MENQQNNKNEYDDNELPRIVWTERPKRRRGMTDYLRGFEVGDTKPLGDYPQGGLSTVAQNLGIKVKSARGTDGKIYVKRIE